MFCPKCGKEMEEGINFCPNCGFDKNGIRGRGASRNPLGALDALFRRYDSGWIISKIATILGIFNIAVRIICNEITTVYTLFVQDDYYTISDSGKSVIITACVVAGLLCTGIVAYCKGRRLSAEIKSLIPVGIGIAIGVVGILLKIPAPY